VRSGSRNDTELALATSRSVGLGFTAHILITVMPRRRVHFGYNESDEMSLNNLWCVSRGEMKSAAWLRLLS